MANPNEIDFKINMPPGPFEDFKKLVEEFKRLYSASKSALSDSAGAAKEIAEAVRIMDERARSTGSASVIKAARGSFSEGFGMASKLDVNYDKLGRGMDVTAGRVNATEAAVLGGQLDAAQGIQLLKKYTADLNKKRSQQGDLDYAMEATQGDLISASPLDDTLASYARVATEIRDTKDAAAALKRELREQADLLAEQREELDMNSATYEQEAAELMKREKSYRSLAAAAEKAENDAASSIQKTQEAFAAYDGSAEAMEKISKATADASANQKKLDDQVTKVANDRALTEQKQAASAEKARNKAEEDAKKAAEREEAARIRAEEKARREEEAAARREQREEEMARRDAERAEKEAYSTSLVVMSKRELYAELQRVNEARQKAAAIGDNEAMAKLNMQYSVARRQVEKTNSALHIQRMMYMQQMQASERLAEKTSGLGESLANIGEAAEEGELDLVGMAEGAVEMFDAFQAGMGPMGWFMLALKVVQDLINGSIQSFNRLTEAQEKGTEINEAYAQGIENIRIARNEHMKQLEREKLVQDLSDYYRSANDSLKVNIDLIEQATNAEIARLSITQEQEQFARTLQKSELGRQLREGTITKDQYNEAIIELDRTGSINAGWTKAKIAREKKRDAEAKAAELEVDFQFKKEEADEMQASFDAEFDVSDHELAAMKKEGERLENDYKDANEAVENFFKEREGWWWAFKNVPQEVIGSMGFDQLAESPYFKHLLSKATEQDKLELRQLWHNRDAALGAKGAFVSRTKERLGGRYFDSYSADKDAAKKRLDIAKSEASDAESAYKEAEDEATTAKRAYKTEHDAAKLNEQNQNDLANSRRADYALTKKQEEEEKKRQASLEKMRRDIHKKTTDWMQKRLKKAEKKANDESPEGRYYSGEARLIRDELKRREEYIYTAREALRTSPEFKKGSAARKNMDWLLGGASKAVKDGVVSKAMFDKLLKALAQSQLTRSQADDDLVKALLLQIKKIEDGDKKSIKKLKTVQYELAR